MGSAFFTTYEQAPVGEGSLILLDYPDGLEGTYYRIVLIAADEQARDMSDPIHALPNAREMFKRVHAQLMLMWLSYSPNDNLDFQPFGGIVNRIIASLET